MATREQIKQQFYDDLTTAVSGLSTVPPVRMRGDESDDTLPKVVYDHFPYPVSYNDGSADAPVAYLTDESGTKTDAVYRSYRGLRFDVHVRAASDAQKNDIYSAVYDHFKRYAQWKDDVDFHADCDDVAVGDASDADVLSAENTIRADVLRVDVEYHTDATRNGTAISTIDQSIDADTDDSTSGNTYTTT